MRVFFKKVDEIFVETKIEELKIGDNIKIIDDGELYTNDDGASEFCVSKEPSIHDSTKKYVVECLYGFEPLI